LLVLVLEVGLSADFEEAEGNGGRHSEVRMRKPLHHSGQLIPSLARHENSLDSVWKVDGT